MLGIKNGCFERRSWKWLRRGGEDWKELIYCFPTMTHVGNRFRGIGYVFGLGWRFIRNRFFTLIAPVGFDGWFWGKERDTGF